MSQYLDKLFEGYPPILSVKDLAEILGLNTKTVYEYLQNGALPAYHIGTKWVIVRDEVISFMRDAANQPSAGLPSSAPGGQSTQSNARGV